MPVPQSLRVFRHREFAWVQSGNTVSNLGTWMQYVANGWAMRQLTHWELPLALIFVVQFVPSLVLSGYAGTLADRLDRRRTVIAGNLAMAVPPLALAVLAVLDGLTIPLLLGLIALGGVAQALTGPAAAAVLPRLVPPDELGEAVSLGATLQGLTRVVGPALGGFALKLGGVELSFALNGISFLAVVVALVLLRFDGRPEKRTDAADSGRLRDAFRFVLASRSLRQVFLLIAVMSACVVHAPLMPAFAQDVLDGDEGTFGLLSAAPGWGAVLGSFAAGQIGGRHPGRALRIGALATGVALLGFSRVTTLAPALALLGLFGLGYFLVTALSMSIVLQQAPDALRGRVMGLQLLCSVGGIPVAGIVGGLLGSAVGPATTVLLAGSVLTAFAVWFGFTREGADPSPATALIQIERA